MGGHRGRRAPGRHAAEMKLQHDTPASHLAAHEPQRTPPWYPRGLAMSDRENPQPDAVT